MPCCCDSCASAYAARTPCARALLAALAGYFVLGELENIIWDRHLWFFITMALFALAPTRADPDDAQGAQEPAATPVSAADPAESSAWTTATSQ